MKHTLKTIGMSLSAMALMTPLESATANTLSESFKDSKAKLDFRLRYENVQQDNTLANADALTLRTRLNYTLGSKKGFSAVVEFEDSRTLLGVDDYSVPPTGFQSGVYSVIADPNSTEVDQAYFQYVSDKTKVRLGRQVIALGNQRFVGHVGWRQDRQVFDALGIKHKFNKDFETQYYFIDDRKRIFADEADVNSNDHLLNVSFKSKLGKLTGYAYLLETDDNTQNSVDTYGISFAGARKADDYKLLYRLEFATQSTPHSTDHMAPDFSANYWLLEGGVAYTDVSVKLGIETLGSDNGNYGFSTPLATLHKFNGWADIFLATPKGGLQDTYLRLNGKALGGKYHIGYHNFTADDGSMMGVDDYGSELDLQYTKAFMKNYSFGIKYSTFSADGLAVDTDKFWVWLGAKY